MCVCVLCKCRRQSGVLQVLNFYNDTSLLHKKLHHMYKMIQIINKKLNFQGLLGGSAAYTSNS